MRPPHDSCGAAWLIWLALCIGCSGPLLVGADPAHDADSGAVDGGKARSSEDARGADRGTTDAAPDDPLDAGVSDTSALALRCTPGMYTGALQGTYNSGAAGIGGLVGPFLEPWSELQIAGRLHFELSPGPTERAFEVSRSCVRFTFPDGGVADNNGGSIEGLLDCETGKFEGQLRGYYDSASLSTLGMSVTSYFFRGPLLAQLDHAQTTFAAGSWDVREPPVTFGKQPGGRGSWSAALDPRAGEPAPSDVCWRGVAFDEASFGDAGLL
jgi:hypothetical protein